MTEDGKPAKARPRVFRTEGPMGAWVGSGVEKFIRWTDECEDWARKQEAEGDYDHNHLLNEPIYSPVLEGLTGADFMEVRDKIEGLEADLESAVETAYNRGATEWTRLNYPAIYARLSK